MLKISLIRLIGMYTYQQTEDFDRGYKNQNATKLLNLELGTYITNLTEMFKLLKIKQIAMNLSNNESFTKLHTAL